MTVSELLLLMESLTDEQKANRLRDFKTLETREEPSAAQAKPSLAPE